LGDGNPLRSKVRHHC